MTSASAAPVLRRFPARTASLGFSLRLPAEWLSHALPEEAPDFSDPARLVSLAAVSAPHAAMVLSVVARPAYADGTVSDWARYLLAQQGLGQPALAEGVLGAPIGPGGLPAVVGEATRAGELGEMRVRFALVEDGGRLVLLRLAASTSIADALSGLWQAVLDSFRLDDAIGPTTPLWPPGQRPPALRPAVGSRAAATPAAVTPAPASMATEPTAPDIDVSSLAPTFSGDALADTIDSLDPSQATNLRLREAGAGEVPRVLAVDPAARSATVACGAIQAQIDLPLGWRAADDGRRVLVFEPEGEVHIHLALLPSPDGSLTQALLGLQLRLHREHPAAQISRRDDGGLHGLVLRGLRDGDDEIEQHEFLAPGPAGPEMNRLLHMRIVALVPRAEAAAALGERILRSVVFGRHILPAASGETGPDWWLAALLLERADRLREAEGCIVGAVDTAAAPLQLAELYRQRMLRLLRAGNPDAADQARAQSMRWLQRHATHHTGAVHLRGTPEAEARP